MTREQFAIGCVILAAAGLGCFLTGLWWGGRRPAEDIAALEADNKELADELEEAEVKIDYLRAVLDEPAPALVRANERLRAFREPEPLERASVIPPGESDTAWMRRMGLELEAWTAAKLAETDEWLREMTR